MDVINIKLCMMVDLSGLHLTIALLVTKAIFQAQSGIKHCRKMKVYLH